jgi:hypothetical protein
MRTINDRDFHITETELYGKYQEALQEIHSLREEIFYLKQEANKQRKCD